MAKDSRADEEIALIETMLCRSAQPTMCLLCNPELKRAKSRAL